MDYKPGVYVAVVKYPANADDESKRRELLAGLQMLVYELAELGVDRDAADDIYESAWDDVDAQTG